MSAFLIRKVEAKDVPQLAKIYFPYIENSHITFETEVPSLDAYEQKIMTIAGLFPFFVAELDGRVLGFAYASRFRERAAYAWALESSIYLDDSVKGTDASPAMALYHALFAELASRGTKQIIAVISLPNDKSVKFHARMGFKNIGVFPSVGYKMNQWWDVLFMTKFLEELPFSKPLSGLK